jgi:hypothetical protein
MNVAYDPDYYEKVRVLWEEIEPVVKAAGIEKELEKAQQLPEADYFRDQHFPSWGTDAYYKELQERGNSDEHFRRWKVRKLLFGVKDEDLRRKLIAYIRKSDLLWIIDLQHELRDKQRNLRKLRLPELRRIFFPAIVGGLMVAGAMSLGLTIGLAVLTGVIIAALYGIKYEEEQRRVTIREAAAKITALRAHINQRVAFQTFSYSEESGTPDEEASRGDINSPKRMMIWRLDRWQSGDDDRCCPICRSSTPPRGLPALADI